MNRQQRRAVHARGLTIFIFFREGPNGKTFFYPIEIPADQLDENIRLNPGTLRVEDVGGNVVWRAPASRKEPSPTPSGHAVDCAWQLDQYSDECTCGASRKEPNNVVG